VRGEGEGPPAEEPDVVLSAPGTAPGRGDSGVDGVVPREAGLAVGIEARPVAVLPARGGLEAQVDLEQVLEQEAPNVLVAEGDREVVEDRHRRVDALDQGVRNLPLVEPLRDLDHEVDVRPAVGVAGCARAAQLDVRDPLVVGDQLSQSCRDRVALVRRVERHGPRRAVARRPAPRRRSGRGAS
jgi:hypothetical protein